MRLKFDRGALIGLAFVLRCSASCALAYEIAVALGLPQPLWAAISAIIVSQERFTDTRTSLTSRVAGTLAGVVVGFVVGVGAGALKLPIATEIAVATAVAAFLSHLMPMLRAAMWTSVIVLLSGAPGQTLQTVALLRAGEVILGAVTGFAMHWLVARLAKPESG